MRGWGGGERAMKGGRGGELEMRWRGERDEEEGRGR